MTQPVTRTTAPSTIGSHLLPDLSTVPKRSLRTLSDVELITADYVPWFSDPHRPQPRARRLAPADVPCPADPFVLATVAVPVVIYGLMPQLHKIRVRLLTQRANA